MPRYTKNTPPVSRNARQAVTAARKFAEGLRKIDRINDFSIFHEKREIVICRNENSNKTHVVMTLFELVAKQIIADGYRFEDVHMHFDGDSLSLYFTETDVWTNE